MVYRPSDTDRRKEAPAMTFVELFRAVVTEVEFCKITAVVSIGKSTGQSEVTLRQRLGKRGSVRNQCIAGDSHQHTAYGMLVMEGPIVSQGGFAIKRTLYRFVARPIFNILISRSRI